MLLGTFAGHEIGQTFPLASLIIFYIGDGSNKSHKKYNYPTVLVGFLIPFSSYIVSLICDTQRCLMKFGLAL